MKLEKIPFTLLYKTNIIGSKNNEELLNTFFSEEANIILTIVKSAKIPESFNSIEPLIEYINMINTQIDDYLLYLYNIYKDYENMTNNNILFHIENINFIIFYHKKKYRLPRNCLREKIYNNKQFIMYLVNPKLNHENNESSELKNASERLRDNKEIVIMAVKNCGDALNYASERLRNDKEIVMIAVKNCGAALNYASERLRDDEEIVLAAIQSEKPIYYYDKIEMDIDKSVLKYVSKRLQDDKQIVLAAIDNGTNHLKYVSTRLQDDREIVLQSVTTGKHQLKYVSERLQDDREIVLQSIKYDGTQLEYASARLQDDEEIVLEAINDEPISLEYASYRHRNNRVIVIKAIKSYSNYEISPLKFVSEKLKDDKEIIMIAITNCGNALRYASERLQDDKEIVLEAIKNDRNAFYYISDNLKEKIRLKLADWCPYGCKSNDDKTINSLNYIKTLDMNIFEE